MYQHGHQRFPLLRHRPLRPLRFRYVTPHHSRLLSLNEWYHQQHGHGYLINHLPAKTIQISP